tara:strand:+ start:1262 stop:2116 length:855 start_codon:yes stop_codon:yes gene_type:complete
MKITNVNNASELLHKYKVILCDLWGVIHNGKELFDNANKFLTDAHKIDKPIFFISNAPRPESVVRKGLSNKLKLDEKYYKSIFTSGDTGARHINDFKHGKSYFHLGPDKDKDLLETINIEKHLDYEVADFILCTGLIDDSFEKPSNYATIFEEFISLDKELVCVNPDEIVYRGENKISCAGGLARLYGEMGGNVKLYGKPYNEIYDYAYKSLLDQGIVNGKSDILAIGDSFKTDILGAELFNIDYLFIQAGIHKNEIKNEDDVSKLFDMHVGKKIKELKISIRL